MQPSAPNVHRRPPTTLPGDWPPDQERKVVSGCPVALREEIQMSNKSEQSNPAKHAFVIGDCVSWVSGRRGSELRRRGNVCEVVPAGSSPTTLTHHTKPRKHESYVIAVPQKASGGSTTASSALYWPPRSKLEK